MRLQLSACPGQTRAGRGHSWRPLLVDSSLLVGGSAVDSVDSGFGAIRLGFDAVDGGSQALELVEDGRFVFLGLADQCWQVQEFFGEDVLSQLSPEGGVALEGVQDVLEGGDGRRHSLYLFCSGIISP